MQFYKRRDFGELISDTFAFFKIYGKNYFKNYLALNGSLLLILVVLYVIGYKSIFAQIINGNAGGQSYYFEQYFQENMPALVLFGLLFLFLFLASVFLIYTFPVLYLKRLAATDDRNITTAQLFGDLKKNLWKFVKFVIGMFVIVLPLMMLMIGFSFFLMFVLIGFFLLILIFPAIVNVINFTLFDYFNTDRGFFKSLSLSVRSQFSYSNGRIKSPFWKYWGACLIMFLIIQTISTVVLLVPMVILGASALTVPAGGTGNIHSFFNSGMGILFFVFYAISILVSFILVNGISINAGLMYYDSRLDLHREENINEIESIGSHEI